MLWMDEEMIYQKYKLQSATKRKKNPKNKNTTCQIITGAQLEENRTFFPRVGTAPCPLTDNHSTSELYSNSFKNWDRASLVVHTCNPCTWKPKAGRVYEFKDNLNNIARPSQVLAVLLSLKFAVFMTQHSTSLAAGNMGTYHHASQGWTRF